MLVLFTILCGFLLVIVWRHNETPLYLFSFEVVGLLLCIGIVCMAFSRSPITPPPFFLSKAPAPGSIGDKGIRLVLILTGAAVIAVVSVILIHDFALPPRILEGHIENAGSRSSYRRSRQHWVIVDGHRYSTTHEVFLKVRIGDRVRAEVATGSTTIFRIERVPTPPTPFPPIPYLPTQRR